jgi:tetratricopeptide (TPR) repeat protein
LRYLTQIIKQAPASPGLHYIYAAVLLANNNYKEAKQQFSWLAEHYPAYKTDALIQQARIAIIQNKLPEGFTILTHALMAEPANLNLLYARGLLAERLGRIDILEEDFKKVLTMNPEQIDVLNILGYTLADKTTRFEEALEYIERALELAPDDPMVLDSMGWIQYRLKNYDEALAYLEQAFNLNADAEIAAHYGEVLWVTGKETAARQVWYQALKQSPNHKLLLDVIRHFEQSSRSIKNRNAVSSAAP